MIDLEAAKKLCEAATPGPWYAWTEYHPHIADMSIFRIPEPPMGDEPQMEWYPDPKHPGLNRSTLEDVVVLAVSESICVEERDLQFMAVSRSLVPELIAEIDRLREALLGDRTRLILESSDYIVWRYQNDIDELPEVVDITEGKIYYPRWEACGKEARRELQDEGLIPKEED